MNLNEREPWESTDKNTMLQRFSDNVTAAPLNVIVGHVSGVDGDSGDCLQCSHTEYELMHTYLYLHCLFFVFCF